MCGMTGYRKDLDQIRVVCLFEYYMRCEQVRDRSDKVRFLVELYG